MSKVNLIGISAQSPIERARAVEHLSKVLYYHIANYDAPMLETFKYVTGVDDKISTSEEMDVYLGPEWSYVREEKFMDDGAIIFKPVRYYLTPKQILTKLRYNMRDIHPDFWVNAFYNNKHHLPPEGKLGVVVAVKYPNEADGIIDHGGVVIRVNNPHYRGVVTKDNLLMDTYPCDYIADVDGEGIEHAVNKTLCTIKNLYSKESTTN
jgi:hypothetical protein